MDESTEREIQEELDKYLESHERFLTSTSARWMRLKSELSVGQCINAIVTEVHTFGVIVEIGYDFPGVILAPNMMPKDGRPFAVSDYPQVGDEVQTTILGFTDDRRQVSLSYNLKR
jgi:ribosomal protein S1